MTFLIREAVSGDASALIALNKEFDSEGEIVSDLTIVSQQIEQNSTERIFVAKVDLVVVGFITIQVTRSFCYDRPSAEVTGIYVSNAFRRRGVASALLDHAKQLAESEDVLELFLRVKHTNTQAIAFYKARGLVSAGHQVFRYRYY